MKKVRGYIFSRPFMGERVPQSVQNQIIREYCNTNGLHYLLSGTEYAMENSSYVMFEVLEELEKIYGIAIYSLFQLPLELSKRELIYKKILLMEKKIFFCLENFCFQRESDIEYIENMWSIKKTIPSCLKKIN